MSTDPMLLQTEDSKKRAEAIREMLSDPTRLRDSCEGAVTEALRATDAANVALQRVRTECVEALALWRNELEATLADLPVPQSVFRSRVSERGILSLCRRMARMERLLRKMGALFARFSEVLVLCSRADALRCSAASLIGQSLYEASQVGKELDLPELHSSAERIESSVAECARECRQMRDAWSGFCFEELPVFLQEARRVADLAGEGEKSDLAALRKLLGDVRHRSEGVF